MRPRQPLPRLWMMTDERQGDALLPAIRKLPRSSGIVFRHYSLPEAERRRLFDSVRRVARARGLFVSLAGSERLALRWGADAAHGGARRNRLLLRTAPVHNRREMRAAERAGADILLLSPVFATRSHPHSKPLGPVRFNLLGQATRLPVIALGGVNARRGASLRCHGWAAIDALTPRRGGMAKRS